MTATFDHHQLRPLNAEDLLRNPRGTWLHNGGADPPHLQCKTVPHITLKSIARNTALDPIFAETQAAAGHRAGRAERALAGVVGAGTARRQSWCASTAEERQRRDRR